MGRNVTLYTAQWGDLSLEEICRQAREMGYDGLELACNDNHFDLAQLSPQYCGQVKKQLRRYNLTLHTLSTHCVGQCVCDPVDERHKPIVPAYIWGDGDPEGVRRRAADELVRTAEAASMLGIDTVVGFTGSPIWHMLYSFPAVSQERIDRGYGEFARRFLPILDEFARRGVRFALEVHPTEIAFDTVSAERALEAVGGHPAFGFNYDPSHLGYQNVDYIEFIHRFAGRIFHVHMKDVWWADRPMPCGIFGGHTSFGDRRRSWDFRSLGRGRIDFEEVIRALNRIGYAGPLSVEWEDSGMDRIQGAAESCAFVRRLDFRRSEIAFDAAFEKKEANR